MSSLEPKARETAEIVAEELRLELCTFANLHEHDRSGSPFLSAREFQNTVREFFLRPDVLVFGNETANQAHQRFSRAIHAALESKRDKTVVVVAHGTVISLFVAGLTGDAGFSIWKELSLPSFLVLDMNTNTLLAIENIP